uniref:Uncharacterized protein n=1 Tax=Nymphaea colorata TaxID=210225 RepID=A0A5K0VNJ2_9MAGN
MSELPSTHSWITSAKLVSEDPPSSTALLPNSFISFIFSLTFLPFSLSNNVLTALSNSSPLTNPPSEPSPPSFSRPNPTPMSLTISTAFILCSAYKGQAMRGTPNQTLSKVEFHPQCDTNPPVARCESMATCGVHPLQTRPRPLVRSMNPVGKASKGSTVGWMETPGRR